MSAASSSGAAALPDLLSTPKRTGHSTSAAKEPYVRLQSSDGAEFIVPLRAACVSGTLRNMLRGAAQYKESEAIVYVDAGSAPATPSTHLGKPKTGGMSLSPSPSISGLSSFGAPPSSVTPMSAYVLDSKSNAVKLTRLPLTATLKSGLKVVVTEVVDDNSAQSGADLAVMEDMLNAEIKDGNSYPQEKQLSYAEFKAYFLSHNAFVCKEAEGPSKGIVGCFYIKPNFPGRANHICNGGFIVAANKRRLGVARFMAECFALLAADLGYRASFFNLVFESNSASVNLWRSLKYTQTGYVPNAIRKADGTFTAALQFYNEFPSASTTKSKTTPEVSTASTTSAASAASESAATSGSAAAAAPH